MADNPPPLRVDKIGFGNLVRKADSNYDRDFSWSTEYEFSNGKTFKANPQKRGAYDPSRVDHVDTINGVPAAEKPP